MRPLPAIALLALLSCVGVSARAGEVSAGETNIRIRDEALFRSQVMRTAHILTDVYGPRLTGSPNYKAAAEWAVRQMQEWGLVKGHLEPWDFGHPGWANERVSAHALSPFKDQLTCEVVAWTPGTNGPVTGRVVMLQLPEKPTAGELSAYFATVRDGIAGKIVFVGKPQAVPVTLNPPPRRRDDKQLRAMLDPKNPAPSRRPGGDEPGDPKRLNANQVTEKLDEFLLGGRALLKVTDAAREHGQIRAFGNRTYDPARSVPAVVMRNEDYGRIGRLLADGVPVELEFDIVNRVYPEGRTTYNVVAEIPGTDKAGEVVMLGGHLDSWHASTGATDNATGCAVMMEAARIIRALGLKPRRTVRVALWAAEEQGLLGSQAYVKEHFGTSEDPKPEFSMLAGYFNIDSGTGRARGASVFGPPEAAAALREIFAPFEDLGFIGVTASNSRRLGGTDSTSFNQAGLPGIGIFQDPIEYGTDTWHTNLDSYERILEEDLKAAAICVASAVYQLAMREEPLPRFPARAMPPPPDASRRTE